MTDFKRLCKNLKKHKRSKCPYCKEQNEYLCAYNMVKKYMDGDENRLLKLKAEARSEEYWPSISLVVSVITLMATVFTLYFTIQYNIEPNNIMALKEWGYLFISLIIIALVLLLPILVKSILIISWKEYILVAIEKNEEEIKIKRVG